jgi:two-component system LytT family sensor kinase
MMTGISTYMKLPQYTKKDWLIFSMAMPVIVAIINFLLFATKYFIDLKIFLLASLCTFLIMGSSWQSLTWIAVTLRNRFPKDHDLLKRLSIALSLFIIITALTISAIFWGYDHFHFLGYQLNETRFKWTLIVFVVINIFITLLHEGVAGFENWKETLTETEQLKKEYMQSQLLGLKSQLNPHFLFNGLNSLSCLINENQQKAETFLNEMSKVYRYLLRNSDEHLVTLETELQFVYSYFYLHKARYGDGITLNIEVSNEARKKYVPPLTLQIILESALNENMISKDQPLNIEIATLNNEWLQMKNNVQKRISDDITENAGLENISNKFRLLCHKEVVISYSATDKVLVLPLINEPEISVA